MKGEGGRCRRHVPTDTHRQPMPNKDEAWATESLGFCWIVVNRAGRTELMPNESEACVESGSGRGIDVRAGFFASINHGKKEGMLFLLGEW